MGEEQEGPLGGATLDPVSGRKHIKHQRSDSEGVEVEVEVGGFTQECFFPMEHAVWQELHAASAANRK